jgi:hypothetical protein
MFILAGRAQPAATSSEKSCYQPKRQGHLNPNVANLRSDSAVTTPLGAAHMSIVPDVEEIVRFLRRFSDLMSIGHNADHLLHAANLIETLMKRVSHLEELLHGERVKGDNELNAEKAVRINFEKENAELKATLATQQCELNGAITNAAHAEKTLRERAEKAEARLTAIEADLAAGRVGNTHIVVPISTLRQAEAQFEALTTEVGNFVAQVMCEVGASSLDRAIQRSSVSN